MRQAGRYLPEYRELRKGSTMVEAITNPQLAAEVTVLPLRRFSFDAAILFSDLTVAFTPMGAPFDIKEGVGPVIHSPVRDTARLQELRLIQPEEDLPYVLETIRLLKPELKVPLIGFTGAPFTLASYLIEGGPSKDHRHTRAMMLGRPDLWHMLMELLAENVLRFLSAQIKAGADAVQLFDSWVGVLGPEQYRQHLLPYMRHIFGGLAQLGVPVIHFGTGNPILLPEMQRAGGDVIGVDWRTALSSAAESIGTPVPLQGNLDPALLLVGGDALESNAARVLAEGRKLPGHIFNLGHGIYPDTPLDNVARLVDFVSGAVHA
jgi:uroporphyrinogen decarboxylase